MSDEHDSHHDADEHDHDDEQAHHAHDAETVAVAIVTISTSRSRGEDAAGDAAQAVIEAAGHEVVRRELVADDVTAIRTVVETLVDDGTAEFIVTLGGTGITPDDVTVDALAPLFDVELPGFGERFRARSAEEIGRRAMASRATAGVIAGVPTIVAPGSEGAAELATDLVAPVAGHLVGLARRST